MNANELLEAHGQDRPILRAERIGDLQLSPEEGFLLGQADGTLTLAELAKIVPFDVETFARSVQRLLDAGVLEWRDGDVAPTERPAPRRPGSGPRPRPPSPPPRPAEPEEPEQIARLRKRIRVVERLLAKGDPFELFGVKRGAGDREIKEAYIRLSRNFHPDRYYNVELPSELRQRLEQLYGELQNAYSMIGTKEARRAWLKQRQTAARPTGPSKPKVKIADADRLAELALEAIRKGQYEAAVRNFKLAAQLAPHAGYDEKVKLVRLLERLEEQLDACCTSEEPPDAEQIEQLEQVITKVRPILPPLPALWRKIVSFLYLHSVDFELARSCYHELERLAPGVETWLLGARLYIKGGLPHTALDLLEKVREADPKHPALKELQREAKRRDRR